MTIFFLISAILFGIRWVKDNYVGYEPVGFLKKRCVRIFVPLWLMILMVLPFEYAFVNNFNWITVIMNFVGLGWVRPFGLSGHLWYITMQMILYVCFIIASRFRVDKIRWYWWGTLFVGLTVIYFVFQERITTYSKAGPPLFTFFSMMIFAKGKEVLKFAKDHRSIILIVTIVMVTLSQYIYQLGWHDSHKALAVGSFICAGFLSFLSLNSYLSISKENKIISWLSGISYEIYLIHAPLIVICSHYVNGLLCWTPLWIITSLACAMLLNKLSNNIINRIC